MKLKNDHDSLIYIKNMLKYLMESNIEENFEFP